MSRTVLLLEGDDDVQVFVHLLNHHNLPISEKGKYRPNKIALDDGGGADAILQSLPTRIKSEAVEATPARLGIVLDVDANVQNRWQAIRDRLRAAGYTTVPAIPDTQGTIIIEAALPTIGVWLMPNNQLAGELEHFVQLLVPDDQLWQRAEQAVQAIPVADRLFAEHDLMKANMHTWLAWQNEPGKPMGQAITKRFLRPEAPAALALVAWVRRLYELPV